jgi:hypothetical protein
MLKMCGMLGCHAVKNLMSSCLLSKNVKIEVKQSCYCHAGDKGEKRYSSYPFLTLTLEIVVSG